MGVSIFGLSGPGWFELTSWRAAFGAGFPEVQKKLPLEKTNQPRVGMAAAIGRATRNAAPL
jgi:hypothetical protein